MHRPHQAIENHPTVHTFIGNDTVRGNLDEAVKWAEEAAALDPLRPNIYLGLGYLLYVAGRDNEAQAELKKLWT